MKLTICHEGGKVRGKVRDRLDREPDLLYANLSLKFQTVNKHVEMTPDTEHRSPLRQ